jgi:hypothetical protein
MRIAPALGSVAALAAVALPAAPAQAAEPWQPVTQPSFSVPAGTYCDDAFSYTPERQHLEQRVLSRYADGPVRQEQFRGLLVGTFTNDATGATTRVNSSGVAVETFRPDGTLETYETWGPVGFGFKATDVGLPRGYYTLRGHHVVAFAPDGTRTLVVDEGTEDDVCAALG